MYINILYPRYTWCKGSGEGDIGSLRHDTDRLTLDTVFRLDVGNLASSRLWNESDISFNDVYYVNAKTYTILKYIRM